MIYYSTNRLYNVCTLTLILDEHILTCIRNLLKLMFNVYTSFIRNTHIIHTRTSIETIQKLKTAHFDKYLRW